MLVVLFVQQCVEQQCVEVLMTIKAVHDAQHVPESR